MSAAANSHDALKNHLLAALPADEFVRVKSYLEPVSFKLGEVLYESGDKMDCVYFPTTAIVSMLYIMENGATTEIGVVGNDGVCGIALFLGGDSMANRAIIQSAGAGFRMKAKDVKAEFALGGVFQQMLLRYTQALMTQISQTAVQNLLDTNALHSDDLIHICSWCKRVDVGQENWEEIEEAVKTLGVFEQEKLPQITHGICSDCYKTMLEQLATYSGRK
ncbi:MAG: Crp/Fnr family transcriptional regulator [Pyrinomonadaceae bacterium]